MMWTLPSSGSGTIFEPTNWSRSSVSGMPAIFLSVSTRVVALVEEDLAVVERHRDARLAVLAVWCPC